VSQSAVGRRVPDHLGSSCVAKAGLYRPHRITSALPGLGHTPQASGQPDMRDNRYNFIRMRCRRTG
jgi:hypothetical protein